MGGWIFGSFWSLEELGGVFFGVVCSFLCCWVLCLLIFVQLSTSGDGGRVLVSCIVMTASKGDFQ